METGGKFCILGKLSTSQIPKTALKYSAFLFLMKMNTELNSGNYFVQFFKRKRNNWLHQVLSYAKAFLTVHMDSTGTGAEHLGWFPEGINACVLCQVTCFVLITFSVKGNLSKSWEMQLCPCICNIAGIGSLPYPNRMHP